VWLLPPGVAQAVRKASRKKMDESLVMGLAIAWREGLFV